MTSVTSLPLAGLSSLGTLKAAAIQIHSIRQVATINAPDLIGTDGDLLIDTGSTSRSNNGHFKIKGGVSGEDKLDAFETGVWNRQLSIGQLTNSDINAYTVAEHLSAGTLLTAVKIPPLNSAGPMDQSKVYALRNVGTSGHVAWGSINDIDGDMHLTGAINTSGNAIVGEDLSCAGDCMIEGHTVFMSDISVAGSMILASALSVGYRFDLNSQLHTSGVAVFDSSLSVANIGVFAESLSVAKSVTCTGAYLSSELSVALLSTFASDISVAGNMDIGSLLVRGSIAPIFGGLNISGPVVLADTLSVSATTCIGGTLSVADNVCFSGDLFDCAIPSIHLGRIDSSVFLRAQTLEINGETVMSGSLSISSGSTVVFSTPVLSVSGDIYGASDLNISGAMAVHSNLSCAGNVCLASGLIVLETAHVGQSLTVASEMSIGGAVTILGNLDVQGTTTTISSTMLTVEDKTLELGVVQTPSDLTAIDAGIIIKGDSDKSITYTRSQPASSSHKQLSSFSFTEDIMLDKKTKPFNNTLESKLLISKRSNVLHIGDLTSVDGHWMLVADIHSSKLQFWYGHDIADDQTMDNMPSSSARLAFEIQRPSMS